MKADKDECVARIRAVQAKYGVKQIVANFAGVKLMIGTPCIDGKYESLYMQSLFQTMKMMDLRERLLWSNSMFL
jgi:hypothetical protein